MTTMEAQEQRYITVPNNMSDLLDLACDDMEALDHDTYVPYYGDWHVPYSSQAYVDHRKAGNASCQVCLAGAVLAGTLHQNPAAQITPFMGKWANKDYSNTHGTTWDRALSTLDALRKGRIMPAYDYFYGHSARVTIDDFEVVNPDFVGWEGMRNFIESARKLARHLRGLGL